MFIDSLIYTTQLKLFKFLLHLSYIFSRFYTRKVWTTTRIISNEHNIIYILYIEGMSWTFSFFAQIPEVIVFKMF